MQKILFIGMPGAGKGTQAQLFIPEGLIHISTGDIIRDAWKHNDPIISEYKAHIDAGGLLPDQQIFELIEKSISQLPSVAKGYILDGAIRTLPQAEFAIQKGIVEKVVYYTLSQEQATKRLLGRAEFSTEKRADDNPETIKNRFQVYKKETQPVLDYLKQNAKEYHEINAEPSVEEIHQETKKVLGLE